MKALARERLAPATEKKRLFFVERLEVIKMPPSLPPSRDHKLTGQLKEYSFLYRSPAKLREGNVFTGVCLFIVGA